ncbi:hypothetical protein [Streptantibioticus ferralitis]|uniref:Uncharacterized protein n=1 Tax=Streptantibioticus ferralitis TaxID=236510 RepID=A0ABT5YVV9_9ACTN|nr:hypothetical protein [Streptantibioticus ferralitis]MDF2255481.1 hypothetical protein [Streptantibioticus ferralitis]
MDPISAAALTALAGGAGGEAGRQAWQGLSALVRRPFRRGEAQNETESPSVSSGQLELTALEDAPTDPMRAQALITALGVRAALDTDFRGLLTEWWQQAQTVSTASKVHNEISGGTQHTVVQGRDFSNITFTVPPATPPTA